MTRRVCLDGHNFKVSLWGVANSTTWCFLCTLLSDYVSSLSTGKKQFFVYKNAFITNTN